MNKALWIHFKHFGRLLGKMYLFLTLSKTNGRVPSQQGAPTTCNVTYWDVSQQTYVQIVLASLECGNRAKLRPSVQSGGGGGEVGLSTKMGNGCGLRAKFTPSVGGRGLGQITHNSSRHQIPLETLNCLFPSNTFFPSTYSFSTAQPAKRLPEERIFLVTDPLGAPEWCRLRYDPYTTHNVDSIPKFYTARQ